MCNKTVLNFVLLLFLFITQFMSNSDELAEQGRKVFERYSQSVVTVKANLSVSLPNSEEEIVSQCTGILIEPRGFVILALSALDPTMLLDPETRSMIQIRFIETKIIFKDDKEIELEVILQDKDKDLLLLKSKEPIPETLPVLSLKEENRSIPQVLDPLLLIMQYGKIAKREHSADILRVEGKVEKPVLFFLINQNRAMDVLSSPLFSLDGKFVGMGTFRVLDNWKTDSEDNSLIIITPAEQLYSFVQQSIPTEKQPSS